MESNDPHSKKSSIDDDFGESNSKHDKFDELKERLSNKSNENVSRANSKHEEEEEEEQEDDISQKQVYEEVLKKSMAQDSQHEEKNTRASSRSRSASISVKNPIASGSTASLSSQRARSVARSQDFEKKPPKTSSTTTGSNLNLNLHMVNDMKYMGDQFKVGKLNPNLQSSHEIRFQKMYSKKLKKLNELHGSSAHPELTARSLNEFKKTKDSKLLLDPHFTLTNELKYMGRQFVVGKMNPKIESPFEKKFQNRFKRQFKNILPDQTKTPRKLNFDELKEMHNKLVIK